MPIPPETASDVSVPRRRLLAGLGASGCRIIVIGGPAGSGKSTVAAQWVEHDARHHVTIRLTPRHDDPARLVSAIVQALGSTSRSAQVLTSTATASEPAFSSTILPAVARLLPARRHPVILVLDDVHLISKPKCEAILESLAAAVPPGSHLVLLTRERTPDWLARLRAQGVVQEVAPHDLAFDVDEADALFRRMGITLTAGEIEQIVADSEGWAVGLYLTALSLKNDRRSVPREPVTRARGSDRYLVDYVRTQVLDEFDDTQRRFLVETSILDELDPSLCAAVTERPDAPTILAELLSRLQLVLQPDDAGPARYHHLLSQALQSELRQTEPDAVSGLHVRAATWYQQAGDLDTAIAHAKAAGDLSLAGSLMWSRLTDCVASGRPDRLQSWLEDLTREQIGRDPWLSMAAAWLALQTADADAIHRWALHCEAFAGPGWRDHAADDEYAAGLAVMRALIGDEGLGVMAQMSEAAYQGLKPDNGFRAAAAFLWGVALTLQGEMAAGSEKLDIAERLGRSLDAPLLIADSLSWRGILAITQGSAEDGIRLIGQASGVIREHQLERLATSAHCITAQALVLAMRGDKGAARTTLGSARRLMTITESIAPWFAVCGRLVQARAAILLGDGALARTLINEARARLTPDLEDTLAATMLAEGEAALSRVTVEGISAGSLTTAELRVLQFLPSHLTFPKIGEHLFLSTNTVKTHALSIYRKLGVSSRAEAVDRARALGLVESPLID